MKWKKNSENSINLSKITLLNLKDNNHFLYFGQNSSENLISIIFLKTEDRPLLAQKKFSPYFKLNGLIWNKRGHKYAKLNRTKRAYWFCLPRSILTDSTLQKWLKYRLLFWKFFENLPENVNVWEKKRFVIFVFRTVIDRIVCLKGILNFLINWRGEKWLVNYSKSILGL